MANPLPSLHPQIETAPFDPRFPQTNQAKHCYTRYNEFHKCVPCASRRLDGTNQRPASNHPIAVVGSCLKMLTNIFPPSPPLLSFPFPHLRCKAQNGEDDEECEKYARYYRSMCPTDWVTKWNEEREAGTWPGRY